MQNHHYFSLEKFENVLQCKNNSVFVMYTFKILTKVVNWKNWPLIMIVIK